MSNTWATLRDLYTKTIGQTQASVNEALIHLTEGYREVAARCEVRELENTGTNVSTVAATDYVTLPTDCFVLIQVDDTTNGTRLWPEPSGMRGRSQYLEASTGTPAQGKPLYYEMSGTRLYLRPTPDAIYVLRMRYKIQPPDVTTAMLGQRPLTPDHMDMAIVFASAISYLLTHPDANQADDQGRRRSDGLIEAFNRKMQEPQTPKERERFDQGTRMVARGFYGMWWR